MVENALGKSFRLEFSSHFDDYMKALGVNYVTRKIAAALSPIFELTKEGDEYHIIIRSTFKNIDFKFKLGKEFQQDTPDGRKVKSTITMENEDTIHEIQRNGKDTSIVRTFNGDTMSMVMKVDDVVCKRTYRLV